MASHRPRRDSDGPRHTVLAMSLDKKEQYKERGSISSYASVRYGHEVRQANIRGRPSMMPLPYEEGSGQVVYVTGNFYIYKMLFQFIVLFNLIFIWMIWCVYAMTGRHSGYIQELIVRDIENYNFYNSHFDILMVWLFRSVLFMFWFLLMDSTDVCIAWWDIIYRNNTRFPLLPVIIVIYPVFACWIEMFCLYLYIHNKYRSTTARRNSGTSTTSGTSGTLYVAPPRGRRSDAIDKLPHFVDEACSTDNIANYVKSDISAPFDTSLYGIPTSSEPEDNRRPSDARSDKTPFKRQSTAPGIPPSYPPLAEQLVYVKRCKSVLNIALEILLSESIWVRENDLSCDDVVESMDLGSVRVFRLKAVVEASPDTMMEILYENIEDNSKWNPTTILGAVLCQVDPDTDIVYTVSAPAGKGLIKSRDFILLRHRYKMEVLQKMSWVLTAVSTDYMCPRLKELHDPKYIRGMNGPTCMILLPVEDDPNKCEIRWLLNSDLKGWIPKKVINSSFHKFLEDYMGYLRTYLVYYKKHYAKK